MGRVVLVAVLLAGCGVQEGSGAARREAPPERAPAAAHVLDGARVPTRGLEPAGAERAYARAAELPRLRCLLVARHGRILRERCSRGPGPGAPANVKSVSKSIVSALVGIAVAEGRLRGPEQPIAPFFADELRGDPRKAGITVGHLLSMQSGLERTSGGNYGRWVASRNWVRDALARPLVAEPGGPMLYSTGNTHLLSALLTEATGESTWAYARTRLFAPLEVQLPRWPTDPQGIYFGGNEMRLAPRGMVRFGELYRNGGRHGDRQVVPEAWVRASLEPRTRSPWSGHDYGYGWFLAEAGGVPLFYAWGYGGQFIFVLPSLEMTVVTTSDADAERDRGHLTGIRALLAEELVPAARAGGSE
jgi:CubicO group peptidase (beta-lactamase class C family)